MAAELFMLEEILDVSTDEEVLLDSDDDGEINIIVAITTFMRRDLHRNEGFCEAIVPSYSMDEFRSHFRMSRGTVEVLCREVAATGRIPQGYFFGRPPIPLQQPVLAFMWFISNSEVIRSVSDRFDVMLSSLDRIIHRVSGACIDLRQRYIKWPNGTFTFNNLLNRTNIINLT